MRFFQIFTSDLFKIFQVLNINYFWQKDKEKSENEPRQKAQPIN